MKTLWSLLLSGHITAEDSMLLANANHRLVEMRKEEVSLGSRG